MLKVLGMCNKACVVTERSKVLPQLEFSEHKSTIAWKSVMDVGDAELTQLTTGQRALVISDVIRCTVVLLK